MTAPIAPQLAKSAVSHATCFSTAITRRPAASAVDGLRTQNTGVVDVNLMSIQHCEYEQALRTAGATIIELPALNAFPDGQFVEDTALCLPDLVVMMRLAAESRRKEVVSMRNTLSPIFKNIEDITDGFIEAGDILTTPSEVLVGLSARTDQIGASQLKYILDHYGYPMQLVETPPDVLHFKTDCSLIDDQCIFSTERLASSGCFAGYHTLIAPEGEEAAANMIRFNDYIIMPAGFPKTEAILKAEGFAVICVGNSECAKIDGGMSCLSLRF